MKRTLLAILLLASVAFPRSPETRRYLRSPIDEILWHRQNQARQPALAASGADSGRVLGLLPDAGNVAVMDESDGVVVAATQFDIDLRTLEFQASGADAAQYTYAIREQRFDAEAVSAGTRLGLGDDEAARVALAFSFPFFGRRHTAVFVHSDGNLTFVEPDATLTRDVQRLVAGPPRIAPFFTDLDPSQPGATISFLSTASRFLVTWSNIPFWSRTPGPQIPRQTLQAALFPDGRIEFSYRGIILTAATTDGAIVGIAPGSGAVDQVSMVDFSAPPSATPQRAAVAEEFSTQPRFDVQALTSKFYRNHENTYDFLVIFDAVDRNFGVCGISLGVRNAVRGIGLGVTNAFIEEFDFSSDFGSPGRLQNFIYMGPLGQFPASPAEVMGRRSLCGPNSTLSVLGREAGHRFLARALFVDPATGRPSNELLGRDFENWNFYLNTDASIMEGHQIEDKGAGVSPRFETKEIIQRFSALDQYLMGLRAPEEVPATFLVRNPSIASTEFSRSSFPQSGLFFDGTRVDVTVQMIQAAEGRRAPDHTVAQRNFRVAFLYLIPAGTNPTPADVAKIERIRTEFEAYFRRATGDRAEAEARLVKQLQLSVSPAAGVLAGRAATASVTLGAPAAAPVTVNLTASDAGISVPGSVTIPAGQRTVAFSITGNSAGVTQLTARGPDDSYETARASIQVRGDGAALRLEDLWNEGLTAGLVWTRQELLTFLALSLDVGLPPPETSFNGQAGQTINQELIFRLRDTNFVPYPGARIEALASGTGSVAGSNLVTDARGWVRIAWKLDANPGPNTLTIRLADQPEVTGTVRAVGLPTPSRHRDPRPPIPAAP